MPAITDVPGDIIWCVGSFLNTLECMTCHTVCKTFCTEMVITKLDIELMARLIVAKFFISETLKVATILTDVLVTPRFKMVTEIMIPHMIRVPCGSWASEIIGEIYNSSGLERKRHNEILRAEQLCTKSHCSIFSNKMYNKLSDVCLYCYSDARKRIIDTDDESCNCECGHDVGYTLIANTGNKITISNRIITITVDSRTIHVDENGVDSDSYPAGSEPNRNVGNYDTSVMQWRVLDRKYYDRR